MFDGKPPSLKSGELAKRTKARSQANENLKKAQETDNVEDQNKYSKMTVRWVGVCVCVCLCVCAWHKKWTMSKTKTTQPF